MRDRLPPKEMAKEIIKKMRKQRPDPIYVKKVFAYVREGLQIKSTITTDRKLPELLTEQEIQSFYEAVWKGSKQNHIILIKLLFYTGIRNSEASNLKVSDVDIDALTIRINNGKGGKDRNVPIPRFFQAELNQYLLGQKEDGADYLFETNRQGQFTPRWIRKIIKQYATKAGITKRMYPHLFRHQLLTYLSKHGIIDTKVQQISGHSDRKSLMIYQSLSLADVEPEYQEAMESFPLK